MSEDPRCCGSGTCIIDTEGRCWCGQRWDGQKMCHAPLSQLEAFAADDAARAFPHASASIQTQFGDANNFMAMVRGGYPMVVRPAAVSFFQPQVEVGTPATVTQLVQLRDREGRLWKATYLLERQTGAGWRISGCVVAADNGKSST